MPLPPTFGPITVDPNTHATSQDILDRGQPQGTVTSFPNPMAPGFTRWYVQLRGSEKVEVNSEKSAHKKALELLKSYR